MADTVPANDASRSIYHRVSQPFTAPRAAMWAALVDKIRAPEKYVGSRDVKILEDTPEYVIREMTIGPPDHPNIMRERITWNEEQGIVKFAFENDPYKTGSVLNLIEPADSVPSAAGDKREGLALTFVFDIKFTDKASQAMIDGFRNMLNNGPSPVAKVVAMVDTENDNK